jgi:predicted O-methyltransferase YrrM
MLRQVRRTVYHTAWGKSLIRTQTAWHNRLILGDTARPFALLEQYQAAPLPDILQSDYAYYTTHVSDVRWTIAPELIQVLWFLLERMQPRVVVDLGSGYSSSLLCRYQSQHDCNVISVDDSAEWLEKTRAYLQQINLPTDGLMSWDMFQEQMVVADIVLHDMGHAAGRIASFPKALGIYASGGIVIADDMHKPAWRTAMLQHVRQRKLYVHDLAPIALDSNLRYGWLIHGF